MFERPVPVGRLESREAFSRYIFESRALQVDADTAGGYLVVPPEVYDQLLQQEQKSNVMRAISRVLPPIEGEELPIPSQESALTDAEWVSELGQGTEETGAPYGKRVLHPHPIKKWVKVSKKLLNQQAFADRWVIEGLSNAVSTPQETAFIQGGGVGEPTGLLNTSGLPVYTTAISGSVTSDEIRNWIFSLPAIFLRRARILTSADFLGYVLKLKDGAGAYIFEDYNGTLLNVPVSLSDGMPTILSGGSLVAGAYAAVIGDFSYYWIGDAQEVYIQRLAELYAEANEVGFQLWQESDGLAVVANAFYALQIKA